MRFALVLAAALMAAFPAAIAAPPAEAARLVLPPGVCPPGTYWTHLPTPGVRASASGFCKSYVVRPTANAPLRPLPAPPPPHGPPHHFPPPHGGFGPHHHGWPPGTCRPWDHWSSRLGRCLPGAVPPSAGKAPVTVPSGGSVPPHQCPPGSHWQAGYEWAGACRPNLTVPVIQRPRPGPAIAMPMAPKPAGPPLIVRPLRHR